MIRNDQRSPKIIREYFELLRWNKNGCVIALAPEQVETDELLLSIKKSLALNEESIILTQNVIPTTEQSRYSIRESVFLLEEEISSVDQSILLLRRARLSRIESTQLFEEQVFSNREREAVESSTMPRLSIQKIW